MVQPYRRKSIYDSSYTLTQHRKVKLSWIPKSQRMQSPRNLHSQSDLRISRHTVCVDDKGQLQRQVAGDTAW